MAFLTINGLDIPVIFDGAEQTTPRGGELERAMFDGTIVKSKRFSKRQYSIRTAPMPLAKALDVRSMINGEGWTWGFADATYFAYSDGTGVELQDAGTRSSGGPFSGSFKITPAGLMIVSKAPGFGEQYTVGVWRYESSTWVHYLVSSTSDGTVRKWVDGSRNDAASTGWLSVTASTFAFDGGGSGDVYADLVILPYAISTDRGDVWDQTAAQASTPQFFATGDMLDLPSDTVINMQRAPGTQVRLSHVWRNGAQYGELAFEITEG